MYTEDEREIATKLREKFTVKTGASEVTTLLLTTFNFVVVLFAFSQATGYLKAGLVILVLTYAIGLLTRFYGWRTVVLTNQEQDFLTKHYKL